MGLDDFKTESSNTTSTSSSNSSSTTVTESSEPDEITPWFTSVINKDEEEVKIFMKKQAFHRTGRHLNEKFLACIETKDEYESINETCKELHNCTLGEFFHRDPIRAADFVKRLDERHQVNDGVECAVCGKTILVEKDEYTKIEDNLVHANHKVEKVVDELNVRV